MWPNDLMDVVMKEVSNSMKLYLVFENIHCRKNSHKVSNSTASDGREFEWKLQGKKEPV